MYHFQLRQIFRGLRGHSNEQEWECPRLPIVNVLGANTPWPQRRQLRLAILLLIRISSTPMMEMQLVT